MKPGAATLREIYNQPEVWRNCLHSLDILELEPLVGDKDPRSHEWIFVGCGTSYYLAQAAAATFTTLTASTARALPASEVLLFPKLVFPKRTDRHFSCSYLSFRTYLRSPSGS